MKACNKCNEIKSLNQFNRHHGTINGFRGECKKCQALWHFKYQMVKTGYKNFPSFLPGMKYCPKCNKVKFLYEFSQNKSNPTGFSSYCKKCMKIVLLNHYQKPENLQKQKLKRIKYAKSEKGKEVRRRLAQKRRQRPEIREQHKKYMYEYHQRSENKERRIIYNLKRKTDPEKNERDQIWKKQYNQLPRRKAKRRTWMKKDYQQNPLKYAIRAQLSNMTKEIGGYSLLPDQLIQLFWIYILGYKIANRNKEAINYVRGWVERSSP